METSSGFETRCRKIFSNHFNKSLQKRRVNGNPKIFDFVSIDEDIIGDAKKLNRANQTGEPDSGERSNIAEYVWLLQHTGANRIFLVFGNDKDNKSLAGAWITKYYALSKPVEFYFLSSSNIVYQWEDGNWVVIK